MNMQYVDVSGNCPYSSTWDGKKLVLDFPTLNVQAKDYNEYELAQNLPDELKRALEKSSDFQRLVKLLPYVKCTDCVSNGVNRPIQTDATTAAGIADDIAKRIYEKLLFTIGEHRLREAEDYLAGQQGLWEQHYIWNPPLKFPRHADESNKDRYDPKLELLKWQTKKNHQEWLEKQKQENQEAAGDTKDEKSGDTLVPGAGPEKTAGEYDNIYKKLQADLEENLKNHSEEDKAKARQHLLSILQDTEADLHNHPQGMEWISDPEHHLYAVKRVIDHLNDSTNYNVDYTRAIIHHSAKGLQNILNIPGKIYSYLKHLEVDPDDWKAYQQEVDVARKAAAQGDSSSLEALADRELKCRSDPNREIPWQTNLVAGLDKPETEPGKILGWFVELATEGAAIVFLLRAAKLLANLKGVGKIGGKTSQKPLGLGEKRAALHKGNWETANLQDAIRKFVGSEHTVKYIPEKGKRIYVNKQNPMQIVEDIGGKYFRIEDTSLPGKCRYFDLDGVNPVNKILPNGKQMGRSKPEYNAATHFYIGE